MNVMMDSDKKEGDLQARLLGDDDTQQLAAAMEAPLLLHVDEEQPLPGTPTAHAHTIEVIDQVAARGEKQPDQYQDAPFAVLFVVHLIAISYFAFVWGIPALIKGDNDDDGSHSYHPPDGDIVIDTTSMSGLLGICALSTVACLLVISGMLSVMIRFAEQLIQCSLILSVAFSFLIGLGAALNGLIVVAVVYFLFCAMGAFYAYCAWRRIPFARANLVTATTAIKNNLGITCVAFFLVIVHVVWVFVWMLSLMGIYLHTQTCDATTGDCDESPSTSGKIASVFFLLSLYWTCEVIKNVLVVTVSGVVSTWWMVPQEANAFFSPAIKDSFSRATSFSFGSICLGSLLVAIIQVLHQLVRQARRSSQRNSLLLCILECLISLLERAVEYFNKYAFIYTGLYGYSYVTAGHKVMELFRARGWTTIINDNLVYRTLMMMNLVVGGLTGCAGMLVAFLTGWAKEFGDSQYLVAFIVTFLIGLAMANVVLGVVGSACDTCIVCFAESPNDFNANHPELFQQMMGAWRQIYPSDFGM